MHAVIFDIDGTLVQSAAVDDALYKESVTSVLGPVEFRPALSDYDFVTDSGILRQVLQDNSIQSHQGQLSEVKARFVEALESHIRDNGPFQEVPGARKMLDNLGASKDHCVALATGGWLETALLKLRSANFATTHMPIATSDDSSVRTEIMTLALSQLGSRFSSITYYGDGSWDREACNSLGWDFVAVGAALGGIDSYSGAGIGNTPVK